ncbi:MAG: hypothetical protein ACREIF_05900 [Chthoniobacterales bacterium]
MNDTVIFFVLAGLALLFKWLTKQGTSDAEKPELPSPNERPEPPSAQSDEERVRRFLEALGVPPGSAPPPPVRPRPTVPRQVITPAQPKPPAKARRSWVQPLPPLVTTPKEVPAPPLQPPTAAPPSPVVIAPPAPVASAAMPGRMVRPGPVASETRQVAPVSASTAGSLRAILRARGSLRQAIMLREILGPPRGLQALDELRSF